MTTPQNESEIKRYRAEYSIELFVEVFIEANSQEEANIIATSTEAMNTAGEFFSDVAHDIHEFIYDFELSRVEPIPPDDDVNQDWDDLDVLKLPSSSE